MTCQITQCEKGKEFLKVFSDHTQVQCLNTVFCVSAQGLLTFGRELLCWHSQSFSYPVRSETPLTRLVEPPGPFHFSNTSNYTELH